MVNEAELASAHRSVQAVDAKYSHVSDREVVREVEAQQIVLNSDSEDKSQMSFNQQAKDQSEEVAEAQALTEPGQVKPTSEQSFLVN